MGTDQLKELKRLQKENERLRRAVSDLTLDKLILSEAARGNFFSIRGSWVKAHGYAF
jgi:putative transposase